MSGQTPAKTVDRLRTYYGEPGGNPEVDPKEMRETADLIESLQSKLSSALDRLGRIVGLVEEQAMDEGLWFQAATAPEAYLQQELRKLHAAIESKDVEKPSPLDAVADSVWQQCDYPRCKRKLGHLGAHTVE